MASKRIEKGLLDTLINKVILGKRKIDTPFRYVTPNSQPNGRLTQWILYPTSRFQRAFSNFVESALPTIKYYLVDPETKAIREQALTYQEAFYHRYFRTENIKYHVLGQTMHPLAYLEMQRMDQFFRRIEILIPGIEVPEWALGKNRYVDFDYDAIENNFEVMDRVWEEMTPEVHFNQGGQFVIQNLAWKRYRFGSWASRLFHNEAKRGTYMRGYNDPDYNTVLDSWDNVYNSVDPRVQKIDKKFRGEQSIINDDFQTFSGKFKQSLLTSVEEIYKEQTGNELSSELRTKVEEEINNYIQEIDQMEESQLKNNPEIQEYIKNLEHTEKEKKSAKLSPEEKKKGPLITFNEGGLKTAQDRTKYFSDLLDHYFPERKGFRRFPKADRGNNTEPYFIRTIDDVKQSVLISKWIDCIKNKVFTTQEIQGIYEFFLHENNSHFWYLDETDGQYKATPLYQKYAKNMNLPTVFDLEKYSGVVVEEQYAHLVERNWEINFQKITYTKKTVQERISAVNKMNLDHMVARKLKTLVTEEYYNPLFAHYLREHAEGNNYNLPSNDQIGASLTGVIYQQENSHEVLEKYANQSRQEIYFLSRDVQRNYIGRFREVVKTFVNIPLNNYHNEFADVDHHVQKI